LKCRLGKNVMMIQPMAAARRGRSADCGKPIHLMLKDRNR
jgi:hypothetical protein